MYVMYKSIFSLFNDEQPRITFKSFFFFFILTLSWDITAAWQLHITNKNYYKHTYNKKMTTFGWIKLKKANVQSKINNECYGWGGAGIKEKFNA